jgi:hypothetical protein
MDQIYARFLRRQAEEGLALAEQSDLLEMVPVDALHGSPRPDDAGGWLAQNDGLFTRYIARFFCAGLVRRADGTIARANEFAIGIWFPPDYLRRANPLQVLTWLSPDEVWHPNIGRIDAADRVFLCIGAVTPGTPLVDLLYRTFETISYVKVTPREDDSLNKAACAWARRNQHMFPIDSRPLKRRPVDFEVTPFEVEG